MISAMGVNCMVASPSSASGLSTETDAASRTSAETIEYLLAHVEQSKLIFIRNGQEHDSRAAAAHLRRKYEHLKSSISTPEEFIEKVASKSWVSGEHYAVRLPGGREMPMERWLHDVLKQRHP